MVSIPYIGTEIVLYEKLNVVHRNTNQPGICEIKIFKVKKTVQYPEGLRYFLFLVAPLTGEVILGLDNHYPKGPHLHRRDQEVMGYGVGFSTDSLVDGFWRMVEEEGYIL